MDDFLEKVKEHAAKAKTGAAKLGRQVYDKTNTAIAVTKLSIAISETDSKIKELYESIGRLIYAEYITGADTPESAVESCTALDELIKEREVLKEKKAELKESVKCPECGSYNKNDSAYCSKCGAKLTEDNSDESSDDTVYAYDGEDAAAEKNDTAEAPEKAEEDTAEEIKEKAEEVIEDVEEKAEKAVDEIEDAAENVIKKVRKVITIKARKSTED